ncbi:ectonucleotide pyrophosphatase/phosphodiesterase family member 3 [Aplochiton taeniatus]
MGFIQHLQRRKAILIGVSAVSLVAIILGLGLGLGLRSRMSPTEGTASCRTLAHTDPTHSSVHPSSNPVDSWECTASRCGEKRLENRLCHCSENCLGEGDCCTNYKHVCQGQTEWVTDDCADLEISKCPPSFKQQPLLLISLDGLRAEYLQTLQSILPVLSKLKTCGTSTPYMQPIFPSKTFPNHYTIATGLYSESHGLIDNNMYDPVFDASFSLSNAEKDNPRWYLGEPIWNTAQYQGLKAGTYFWPGSDVMVNGSFPYIYRPYNGKVPFEERVFTVLKWLQLPDDQRPDFYTLYLEEPDKSGHSYGPVSDGLTKSIQGVDRIMGQLMNGLKQLDLHQCLNIVIVADHGMEETNCDRKETLQELVGDVKDFFVTQGPFGRIRAINKNEVLDSAQLVANMSCKKPGQKIKAYLKSNLPKRFHYANSKRIEDVSVLVQAKWLFEKSPGSLTFCSGGDHGYDNDVDSMHAMFLSYGPKFLSRTEVEPFSNIELYNLMCDVLQISPASNNGSHGSLNHLLRAPYHTPSRPAEQSPPGTCPLTSLEPADALNCSCPVLGGNNVNNRLNLTDKEKSDAETKHAMFGRPRLLQASGNQDYCLLHHRGYVSGYSKTSFMPLWSSFTLDKPDNTDPLPGVTPDCLRADVRLAADQSPRCNQNTGNITHSFLYPANLNKTAEEEFDGLLLSNLVPMYPDFKKVWDYFHSTLLKKYASQYNSINVVTGPVFDYNYDGLCDSQDQILQFVPGSRIPVPTHYFAVLTSCRDSSQAVESCSGELQTVSFLLPHKSDNSESCKNVETASQWAEDLLWFHQSRVRDVEWITGLDFYQGSLRPIPELLRLKVRPTAAIHRKA